MRNAWLVIVVVGACRSAPQVTSSKERVAQLELELTKATSALAKAEAVIAVQREAAKPRGGGLDPIPDEPATVVDEAALPVECIAYKAAVMRLATCDAAKPVEPAVKRGFDAAWTLIVQLPADHQGEVSGSCKVGADGIRNLLATLNC